MEDASTAVATPIAHSASAGDASQAGSASGSFQSDAFLGDANDAEFGFGRPEFRQLDLPGTVQIHDRHVFLCYKTPQVWPPHVEAAEFDRLPRLLSAALKARRGDMKKRTRLTICEGEDGSESSNGDIMIFPDMIRYRRLTHFDVDNFVEEALVKDAEWLPGAAERLAGSYVFVCAHGSRDKRCGVCGPALIQKFKEEIKSHGLEGEVSVSPCSHIGGHKYAGNIIIFSRNIDGDVSGHWYGYVSPDDVPALLEQHIGKGEILTHLWRGQMGLSEEEQKKVHDLRLQQNGGMKSDINAKEQTQTEAETETFETANSNISGATGCCQGNRSASCCQTMVSDENLEACHRDEEEAPKTADKSSKTSTSKGASSRKDCALSTWFECWEREDTYAALAVVAAVVSVTVAYSCYKQLK